MERGDFLSYSRAGLADWRTGFTAMDDPQRVLSERSSLAVMRELGC